MKYRLNRSLFWALVVAYIPIALFSSIFWGIALRSFIFTQQTALAWVLLVCLEAGAILILSWVIVANIKEAFSIVTFNSEGVSVSFFKHQWYNAKWDEIRYIEQFECLPSGIIPNCYLYLSKVSLCLDKSILVFGRPSSTRICNQGIFLQLSKKMHPEIYLYIDKNKIVQHGLISLKKPKAK